ncbi:hypothetical protein SKAU_G00133620 [Synaphobranchus kaupii]|uniref:Uncharacterized protein n=1 Tax=Synaphobranchus kaupii TaxID=118154 RepID=A0A9Q1FRF4_SYNKA|nr:hypothetical protein SKAU_G00133620 [Synaphobranchus kaupii]
MPLHLPLPGGERENRSDSGSASRLGPATRQARQHVRCYSTTEQLLHQPDGHALPSRAPKFHNTLLGPAHLCGVDLGGRVPGRAASCRFSWPLREDVAGAGILQATKDGTKDLLMSLRHPADLSPLFPSSARPSATDHRPWLTLAEPGGKIIGWVTSAPQTGASTGHSTSEGRCIHLTDYRDGAVKLIKKNRDDKHLTA